MTDSAVLTAHASASSPSASTDAATLDAVAAAAAAAAPLVRASADADCAGWLRAVADALDANAAELVAIADEETHLGTVRLTGEVARTTEQLRLFATVVDDGAWREITVDHADASATPPRPEIRRMLTAVGPVAVYSASNFPFAFSVAGGDTASALAAGCPVIVKAHSGHPRLSVRTAEIVTDALTTAGAPDGIFALVVGREAGNALVQHPAIAAAGFTGSLSGGRALFDLASGRPDPIPFYGELGSINPVVITAAAIAARGGSLATGLAGSFTLGSGQFCTKPGVVFVPTGTAFADDLAAAVGPATTGRLLTDRIASAFPVGLAALAADDSVTIVVGAIDSDTDAPQPVVLRTDARAVATRPDTLLEECFGPVTLLVEYADEAELFAALGALGGSLTATLHSEPGEEVASLVERLSQVAGRVLFAGWPTGVAVTWSQHHGGPWPATTSLHTSVGASAIRRFLRPIAFQDAPDALLPAPLRDANLAAAPRRVDGTLLLAAG
ncbi:aldehyde dehydrogenase (NADP(+)) [Leifsonia sp. Leaf264]|uniref:aldehyde dehydrogenase (NADP(+)) n=1 Tax=Leifsonia sp. Leaf264 TaxID=1736314 RepID=UPI0006FC5489|nr:aldehyde dehydrogenase (NADP(+)) [Leifsonia sp. Leaf264]KQO97049.1 aldehyde dehydrogenase [Leifsonia sp. Leaf264]